MTTCQHILADIHTNKQTPTDNKPVDDRCVLSAPITW